MANFVTTMAKSSKVTLRMAGPMAEVRSPSPTANLQSESGRTVKTSVLKKSLVPACHD